jgi:hypothetical protein
MNQVLGYNKRFTAASPEVHMIQKRFDLLAARMDFYEKAEQRANQKKSLIENIMLTMIVLAIVVNILESI